MNITNRCPVALPRKRGEMMRVEATVLEPEIRRVRRWAYRQAFQVKFFVAPVSDSGEAEEELNRFVRGHGAISV